MFKLTYVCAAAAAIAAFSHATVAQDQGPGIPYQGRGIYSTYGNQTYDPKGTIQFKQGNQTYTQQRKDPGPTYSTLGHQTYGSDGSLLQQYGNTTYENNGAISQTHGNQTNIYRPGAKTVICSTYGNQTVCK
jgi:hypothetical protein